jgi:hypothetical protein
MTRRKINLHVRPMRQVYLDQAELWFKSGRFRNTYRVWLALLMAEMYRR